MTFGDGYIPSMIDRASPVKAKIGVDEAPALLTRRGVDAIPGRATRVTGELFTLKLATGALPVVQGAQLVIATTVFVVNKVEKQGPMTQVVLTRA